MTNEFEVDVADTGFDKQPARQQQASVETGVPGVGARSRRTKSGRAWIVLLFAAALIGVVLGLSVFLKRVMADHQAKSEQARAEQLKAGQASSSAGHDFSSEQKRIKADEATAQAVLPQPAGAQPAAGAIAVQANQPSQLTGGSTGPQRTAPAAQPAKDVDPPAWYSGVTLDLKSKSSGTGTLQGGKAEGGAPASAAGRNALDDQLAPSAASRATTVKAAMDGDLTYMLRHGTLIACVGPRIVTTYPGMGSCTLMDDVYSANGRTLLMRKGATAHFEQRTALTQGQARIFALFTEIDDGRVSVTLDSPATDPLGGSGIDAWVDNHFWTRFGGAIMIGLIGDVGQMASNMTAPSGSGSAVSVSNTSSNAQQAMTELLRNTVNVAPTAYTNQGSVIYIYVARNADFGGVYELVQR